MAKTEAQDNLIKVGFCIAYDWRLLEYSIPPIYKEADKIILSVDKDRISWAGTPFTWDEPAFRQLVKELDTDNKIDILEEDYHLPELKPMENEVRQRMKIAAALGAGGWHIQLDTDEFFLNFSAFVSHLRNLPRGRRPFNVSCPWITLYKQDSEGFFYVAPERFEQIEFIQIATLWPSYEYGRRNGNFNILTDCALLHLSWARPEAEIWEKLNNWGHKDDFDIAAYFSKWKELNSTNYQEYRNFHHIRPEIWPGLKYLPAKSVVELLPLARSQMQLPMSPFQLKLANSIWWARIRRVFRLK